MQASKSQRKVAINLKLIQNSKTEKLHASRQSFDFMNAELIKHTEQKYPTSSPSFTQLEKASDDESESPYLLRCKDRHIENNDIEDFGMQNQNQNDDEGNRQIQGKEVKKYKMAARNSIKLAENNLNSTAQSTSSTLFATSPFSNNMIASIVLNEKLEQTNLLVNNSIIQQSYSLYNKQQPPEQQQNMPQCIIKRCSLKHKPPLGGGSPSEATTGQNQLNQVTFPTRSPKIKLEDQILFELYKQNQEQYQIESSSSSLPQKIPLTSDESMIGLEEATLTCRQQDNDIQGQNLLVMSPCGSSQSQPSLWTRSLTKYTSQQQQYQGDSHSNLIDKNTVSNIILNRRNNFQNSPVFAKNNKELFLRSFQNINKIIQNPNQKDIKTEDAQESAILLTCMQETSNYYAANLSNSNQKLFAVRKIKPNASINFSEKSTDFQQTSKRFLSIDKLKKNTSQLREGNTLQDSNNTTPSNRFSLSHLKLIENYPNKQVSFQNRFRNTSREITSPSKNTFRNTQILRNHTSQEENSNLSQILMIPLNNQNNKQTIFGISSRPIIPTRLLGFSQ